MECNKCGEFHDYILDHLRVMHPDVVVDQVSTGLQASLLKPVTQAMNDDDWVCEDCDEQFLLGQLYGEVFEGLVGDKPIVSLVCGECYMARLDD